jgi:D-serine deaminase-like pyridoxal phosphate-dependent protein
MTRVADLDTPAILIDVDIMERNLARVADYAREHGLRLRPHTKTHKIPALARRQIDRGAAGITVAKTSEAEVMLRANPTDLLVAYPVIGAAKTARLMKVAEQADVTVSLDSDEAARQLSAAAGASGRTIGVLVEIDVGLRRVGVQPGTELLALAKMVDALPGIDFRGIAFYPGHIKLMDDEAVRQLEAVDVIVNQAVSELRREGLNAGIVSGGSTPALFHSHLVTGMNEIRPGTYIFNDRNTWKCGGCSFEDCAATILCTVVSTSVPDRVILDGGSKTFSSDRCSVPSEEGFGLIPQYSDALFEKMNEEHGFFDVSKTSHSLRVGDRVRVLPNHICVAMNLHEQVYGVREDEVVEVWKVEARGRLQ